MLQSEVLDRHWFTSLAEAESALPSFADYYQLSATSAFPSPTEASSTFLHSNISSLGWNP